MAAIQFIWTFQRREPIPEGEKVICEFKVVGKDQAEAESKLRLTKADGAMKSKLFIVTEFVPVQDKQNELLTRLVEAMEKALAAEEK